MKTTILMVLGCVCIWQTAISDSLRLRLLCDPCRFELGTPIRTRVMFENRSDAAYYVYLTPNIGPKALSLVAERGGCRYEVESRYFDTYRAEDRFGFVPLRRETRLELDVQPLNDPANWGLPGLTVPGPGAFKLSASFTSEGSYAVGVLFPIWRGTVRSDPVDVIFTQPAASTIREWRTRLEACGRGDCTDYAPIEYFRFVRDDAAADVLITLLPLYPESPSIFPAILHQARITDVAAVEAFAAGPPPSGHESVWPRYQEMARETARALRAPGPCGAKSAGRLF